ncbi:hypothetical protein M430DRAFT_36099 [Amorphotheca resinae ATCC 22711]|uniref:Rhomboid family membrane protein n=1 Tax=Amorphotheca resinae ATCC 22711 TaxID=857342 RepID=A0A2T3AW33_AMORE|nr:hypothetical protein M430DRAFT_36099 [Amorphotheca resinae ATCC 22711]PSS12863.1 hypothetical protein M430DRAFT_36099 [Amorphotheca resinae ATCC 22711]
MSTSTPQAPSPSTTTTNSSSIDQAKLIHNMSVAALIACPILILIPPRKFDIYTIALLTGTLVSANQLTYEYSGRSFATRWGERLAAFSSTELPPKAQEMQERLRREREVRDAARLGVSVRAQEVEAGSKILEEVERRREGEGKGKKERGILERVWYGQEGDDWKQKRDQREKEALEEGKGYGDLIMEQIWEVWNWGGKKTDQAADSEDQSRKEQGSK